MSAQRIQGSQAGPKPAASLPAVRSSRAAVATGALTLYTGATMLAAQAGWMRLAQTHIGSSVQAGAVALSAAMAGLAVGAALAARLLARRRIGAIACGQQLALVVALAGSPWLIWLVGQLARNIVRAWGLEVSTGQSLVTLAVGVLLVLLNVPFGMLLPVAVELLPTGGSGRGGSLSRRGGLLYAIQSAGAMAGALLLGMVLPARVGFAWALVLMAAGHAAIAASLALRRGRQADAGADAISQEGKPIGASRPDLRLPRAGGLWGLAFLLGLLGLAAEMLWVRGLIFYFSSSLYAYGLTAAVFVGSLSAGGLLGAWLAPRLRRPGQWLAGIALLIAVALGGSAEWLERLADWPAWAGSIRLDQDGGGLAGRLLSMSLAATAIVGAPGLLMGGAFPFLLRLARGPGSIEALSAGLARKTRSGTSSPGGAARAGKSLSGRLVARVVSANSLGSMIGPLLALGVLLQSLDTRRSLLAVAIGYMLSALWAEALDPATGWHRSSARAAPHMGEDESEPDQVRHQRIRQAKQYRIPWPNLVLFAVAAVVCFVQSEEGSVFRLNYLLQIERTAAGKELGRRDELASFDALTLPLLIESPEGVVAVQRQSSDGAARLWINQHVQGDDSAVALLVQRRQGIVPLLVGAQARPRRALVIGLGTGGTVAPLVQAGVEQITVAELVPAVRTALDEFAQANEELLQKLVQQFEPSLPDQPTAAPATQPASQPRTAQRAEAGHVRILALDGRVALALAREPLDLVLVDIVYPTHPGAGNLFSRQFYRLARDRLASDGLFVQWLPLWQMTPDTAGSVIAAFLSAFGDWPEGARFALLSLPSPSRPMLALVAAGGANLSGQGLARRIEALRPSLEKSDRLPSLARMNLGRAEEIWADLLSEPTLRELAGDAPPMTDMFPRTELAPAVLDEERLGAANLDRLLASGYADKDYAARIAGSMSIDGFEPGAMAPVFRGRRRFAEAIQAGERQRRTGVPENLQALLDAAVKANPHDSFARRYQQRNDLEARTNPARDMARQAYRLHAARQPEEALKAAYSAVGRLDRLIADFPDAQEPRWLKARLLQLIGQIEPANQDKLLRQALELAEAICRAFPLAADPLLLKAGVLVKLGRLDGAKVTLKQAENLRQVGPDNRPEEYRRVRAILTKLAARQATTTQDRGGK